MTDKWYFLRPKSAQENDTHKIPRDFEIQTDHQLPTRRLDQVLFCKKKEFVIEWILPFQ